MDISQFAENPDIIQKSEYSTRKNYSSTAYYEVTKDFNVNIVKFLLNEHLSAFGLGVSVNETNLLQIIKI
ncbi:MAG: hypothetical protein LBM93_15250 [Oscillospiraceae bacterium]|jgi:hypothetical protein|nr:hypothetical protein [Oscillospiraceae bacterium]